MKTSIRRHAGAWLAAVAMLVWLAPISAHEVIVEQIVEMQVIDQGTQLVVRLQIPAAVAGATARDQLRIVAADIAHSLDVRQGGTTLADPGATTRAGAAAGSIEVELRYPVPGAGPTERAGFSARLNAFSSKTGPVRTVARYQPASGAAQIVSVTGPAIRVTFDPPVNAVIRDFAVRGLRVLFDGGDHLLFLVCLLLPLRRARSVFVLVGAVVLGQAVAMVVSVNRPPMSADWMAGAAMVAASAIVIATLQGVVRARMRWTILVALAFGMLNGCLLAQAAVATSQFGGENASAAMFTFAAVVLIGELWLAALAWAFRAWLDERGLPDRVVALIGLAMVAHQALHRVVARSAIVAQDGSPGGEHALVWLTLAWIGAVLFVAASNAVAGAPVPRS